MTVIFYLQIKGRRATVERRARRRRTVDKIELLKSIREWLDSHDRVSSLKAAENIVRMIEEIGLIRIVAGSIEIAHKS